MEINPKEEIKEELAKMDAVSDVYIENMELKDKLKKQSKELEELMKWKKEAGEMLDNIKYWDTTPQEYLNKIAELLKEKE